MSTVGENYSPPTFAVSREKQLEEADPEEIRKLWSVELEDMEQKFFDFTKKPYYVSKIDYLRELLPMPYPTRKRRMLFAPTGCMKTSMCITIQKFFSCAVPTEEQQQLKPLFEVVGLEHYNLHAHNYVVFRMSFRNLILDENSSLESITKYIFKNFERIAAEYKLALSDEDEDNFSNSLKQGDIFYECGKWLHKKANKDIIFVIDEIDHPLARLVSKNLNTKQVQSVWDMFNKVIEELSKSVYWIPLIVCFGIHPVRGIVDSRAWIIERNIDKEFIRNFMFTEEEVLQLIEKYKSKITEKTAVELLTEITACYGGYLYGLFCPASVVRYLESGGKCKLYKWTRCTLDIMDINILQTRINLVPFIDEKEKQVRLDFQLDLRSINTNAGAIVNYLFAGLLQLRDINYESFPTRDYCVWVANRENLNILGYFLEKMIQQQVTSDLPYLAGIVTDALSTFNFIRFEAELNKFFRTMEPFELTRERDYHNPLHAFLYVLRGNWVVSSEYSKSTGNEATGESGRIDLRLKEPNCKK